MASRQCAESLWTVLWLCYVLKLWCVLKPVLKSDQHQGMVVDFRRNRTSLNTQSRVCGCIQITERVGNATQSLSTGRHRADSHQSSIMCAIRCWNSFTSQLESVQYVAEAAEKIRHHALQLFCRNADCMCMLYFFSVYLMCSLLQLWPFPKCS